MLNGAQLLGDSVEHGIEHTARKRDAIRILFILEKAGVSPGSGAPEGAVSVVKAEKRLQALDFWMRCPDYLAAELLDMHEQEPSKGYLEAALLVMEGDEPDVRRLHMTRFLFGAWELIDDSMSQLVMLGLADIKRIRREDGTISRTDFFLLENGKKLCEDLAALSPHLVWYRERAALVALVAGKSSGDELKKRQYKQAEYEDARWGQLIGSISQRVLKRLQELRVEV